MNVHAQLEAIMAVPIGAAVIAFALGFFGLAAGIIKHVIETRAQRRAYLRGLADRMPNTRPRSVGSQVSGAAE